MAEVSARLRELPSVDEIVAELTDVDAPRSLIVAETRRVLGTMRTRLRAGEHIDPARASNEVRARIEELQQPSLRRVINATGVILHTNLGRAPGVPFEVPQGYSNLEYDLARGRRGKRDTHISGLIERLAGKPGIAVNNNAAAVLLVLNELASGGEAIVSRGELIEIGDGFRIPDIMKASGAGLCEVGTTNRTHLDDYRAAINDRTRVILRVHPSNFHIEGFTAKPRLDELASLAHERNLPLYEDLGSGCVVDLSASGIREPLVRESLDAGVNLVSFSGDKLLGGPQAGLIVGDAELVTRLRRNPLFRALRIDKLITSTLETTLKNILFERWHEIPALAMIRMTAEQVRERAAKLAARLPGAELLPGESVAGGGSTPEQSIPTWLIALPGNAIEKERSLRSNTPPVIARTADDRVVIDLRTVLPEEEETLFQALSK